MSDRSVGLNAEQLEAIAKETRAIFLEEEAAEYLVALEQGIEKLTRGEYSSLQKECVVLIRAAHSIKGGASLAQLPSISQLAHQLEDLLLAIQSGSISDLKTACSQAGRSIEEIRDRLNDALGEGEISQRFSSSDSPLPNRQSPQPDFVKKALNFELEECLQRVESLLLNRQPSTSDLIKEAIAILVEECTLLGQVLSLTWLSDAAEPLRIALHRPSPSSEQIAMSAIAHLREMRSHFLSKMENPSREKETFSPAAASSESPLPNLQTQTNNKKSSHIPERFLKYVLVNSDTSAEAPSLNLRVPIAFLDRVGNVIGEFSLECERLNLYREQIERASRNLKKIASPVDSIPESSKFYLRELMVKVDESSSDTELIARELQETLERMRVSLDKLQEDLKMSRLVPFGLLADRFQALLQTLMQKYRKSVELVVEGKDTLVDRAVLEQLQTPLTQLFHNAFDHGIEPPAERRALGKPPMARIWLSAATEGNQISIAIADDGRGIDLQKVYQRALEMGLIDSENYAENWEDSNLRSGQILEFLLTPGFSTTTTASEISGRGVGLDIVRHQIRRMRGSVQVETTLGKGSKFTVCIPLTLNILSLLLCRCGQRTLAIPAVNVLEIISLSEFLLPKTGSIDWNDRSVPLFPLIELLPYNRPEILSNSPILQANLGIVLNVNDEPVVVAVDALLGERELVVKAFDDTVPVPDYVVGCTMLATGEVVPILSPNQFGELMNRAKQKEERKEKGENSFAQFSAFSASPRSILIADDSMAVRRALDYLLSQAGYQVVQCRDGQEALEELQRTSGGFDLAISDLDMPRMNGFALLKAIRAHPNTWNLPVVILTARNSEVIKQQAMKLGATAYLTKPFAPDRFIEAIATLLAG